MFISVVRKLYKRINQTICPKYVHFKDLCLNVKKVARNDDKKCRMITFRYHFYAKLIWNRMTSCLRSDPVKSHVTEYLSALFGKLAYDTYQ